MKRSGPRPIAVRRRARVEIPIGALLLCLGLPMYLGQPKATWAVPSASETEAAARQDIAEDEEVGEEVGDEQEEAPTGGWSALTTGGSYRVEIEADPYPIPLNEMFTLHFRITEGRMTEGHIAEDPSAEGHIAEDPSAEDPSAEVQGQDSPLVSGAVVTASARMPEHQHGTNLQPRITSHGDGTATGVGFLWHMEGKWELRVGVASGGKMEWTVFPFELEP